MFPTALHIQCVERQSKHTANALHGHSAAPSSQKTARLLVKKGLFWGLYINSCCFRFYLIETYVEKKRNTNIRREKQKNQ